MSDKSNGKDLVSYSPGENIFTEGEAADNTMCVIVKGKVNILIGEGEKEVVVARLGEGELFGEMAWVTKEPRSATVRADGPVKVRKITVGNFEEILAKGPDIVRKIVKALVERLKNTTEQLVKARAELAKAREKLEG